MLTQPSSQGLHTPRAGTGFLRKSHAIFRSEPAAQSRSKSPALVKVASAERDKIVTPPLARGRPVRYGGLLRLLYPPSQSRHAGRRRVGRRFLNANGGGLRRRWATLPRSRFATMWNRLEARRKQAMWMLAVQILASRIGTPRNDHVDALPKHRGVVRDSNRAPDDGTGAVLAPVFEIANREHGPDAWTRRRVPRLNSGFWRRLHAARGRARTRGRPYDGVLGRASPHDD